MGKARAGWGTRFSLTLSSSLCLEPGATNLRKTSRIEPLNGDALASSLSTVEGERVGVRGQLMGMRPLLTLIMELSAYNFAAIYSSNFLASALNSRIPSEVFSVAIAFSLRSQRKL